MGNLWNIVFMGGLVLIWLVSGILAIMSAVDTHGYRNDDKYIHSSWAYSTSIACIVGIMLTGLAVIVVIGIIVGGLLLATPIPEIAGGVGGVGAVAAVGTEAAVAGTEAVAVGTEAVSEAGEALEETYKVGKKGIQLAKKGSKIVKKVPKKQKKNIGWLTLPFLGICLGLVFLNGILAMMSSIKLKQSPNYDPKKGSLQKAYNYGIYNAILCLGAVFFIGIFLVQKFIPKK